MKKVLIFLINCYQKIPFSSHKYCRFFPSCSEYVKESLEQYGLFKGSYLAMKRILRCNPFGSFGYDPVPVKERKKMKKLLLICELIAISFFLSGCKNDSMDNIEIIVTNYPNEYILKSLYSNHATISSIYPDGVDTNTYKISEKQKKEYAKKDLFVYNGLIEKERSLAVDLLAINPDLKIIDTAYVLETNYSPEEMWLNPASLLMMSQNVRLSLNEYASSTYLRKDIDDAYEQLKITLSEADADYRIAVDSTNNKVIVVADNALKYLEKFGLQVFCIDKDTTQKAFADAENLINDGTINYIFLFDDKVNEMAQDLINKHSNLQTITLHRLDNLSDQERSDKKDYIFLIEDNLELIKKELYQ